MSAAVACIDGVDVLMEYLEGTLDAERRASVDAHMHGCPRCVAFVKSYVATPNILRGATQVEMPDQAGESLRLFLARRRGTPE
jgi:anti-sigma factor RsiW